MSGRKPSRTPRIILAPLLAIVVATGVFGSAFFAPQAAQAQYALPVVDVPGDAAAVTSGVANTTTATTAVKQSAWDVLKITLTNTAELAILEGANYFAQKIAYDTANYVASGGNGQKPFFTTDGLGDYLANTAKDAAADVLGTLSKDPSTFGKFGFNLCAPSDPRVALNIQLGFLNGLPGMLGGPPAAGAPKPVCSWDTFSHNWDQFKQLDSDTVLNNVGVMFTPGQSSLSSAIQVNNAAINLIGQKQQAALNSFVAHNGFLDKVSKVGGKVLTPADTIKTQLGISMENGWKQGDKTVAISGSAFGNGAFGILPAALHTFTNTLAQAMMKKVFEKGLITLNDILGNETDHTISFNAAPPQGGLAAAELSNASLLTPNILSIANYDALTEFAACPQGTPKSPNNCVMDQQFFTALNRASQGAPLTVRQAADQGFLNVNWPLLPLAHRKNLEQNCYTEAFCYSNLVKLRKASVLPIGWELAANSEFNDVNRPVTLGEAMNRFDDCPRKADGSVDEAKLPDSLHPWCHLIDPEWVLKYPVEICRQQAPGPTLVSPDSAARAQICVDSTTCIAQDASGNCVGGYGYCVREKNVWNMDADACPAYYASCTSFHRADGAASSFLSNTLDSGPCNSQNAGCRQYSQTQNAVPNPGFEDLLDGKPRDWTLGAGARLSQSGLLSEHGLDAVGVTSSSGASVTVYSLQPGEDYVLSAAVLQELESVSPVGTATLKFFQPDGNVTAAADISTTCTYHTGDPSVSLDVSATQLGYLSGSCKITVPADATYGKIELSSNVGTAGNRTWFDDLGLYGASFSASPYDSLLLNGKVEKCAADQAGCTDLVRMSTGTLNLVRDSSFEVPDANGGPSFWKLPTASLYEKGTLKSFDGVSSVRLDPAGVSQDVSGLLSAASYDFSVYSMIDGSTAGNPKVVVQLYDTSTPPAPVAPSSVDGCDIDSSGTAMRMDLAAGSAYQRSVCSFTTPEDVAFARVTLSADAGSTALADAAQMELSVQPSGYHDGYDPAAQHVYLKTAPEGLNCSGQNRSPDCDNFAPSCRRDEVGCNSYTPDAGGIAIPAVTVAGDSCPTECVGYDAFREEPSNFNDPRFPLFIVPATAQSCTASESGCSEFTNVQKLASGGESREYFSYLRLCAKPDQNAGTFYTWEGNDAKGYQLRTWPLLKSNVLSVAAGDSDPTGGNAPCTKLVYDNAARPVCSDDTATPAERAAATCLKSDLLTNPDCREFYDVAGNIHYRLYSKTIVVDDNCTEYRITKSTDTECVAHGGLWRNNECHYFSFAPESQSCRSSAAGCRAYSGNSSRNVRVAMSDQFEEGTTDGWTAAPGGGPTSDVENSNESVTAGGHSLKVSRSTVTKDVSSDVRQGKSYVLSFWGKGDGDLDIAFSTAGDQPFTFNRLTNQNAPVTLGTEWRPYQVGPVTLAKPPADDEHLTLTLSGNTSAPLFYIDNVELREITDNLYLIQDSWKTPASCDQTPTGESSPQYMLGCRAYHDRLNQPVALKSFDRICRPEAVGCEAMYDTHHTDSPFPQTFSAVCTLPAACVPSAGGVTCSCKIAGQTVCQAISGATTCRYDTDDSVPASRVSPTGDTVRIPADGIVYLVNDVKYACAQENVGCTAMGDKTMTRERTAIQSWATVYLKNNPASYADTLCKKSEEYCQAYTRDVDGSSAYFKDPELRTCEFKENISGYSGWFKTGTTEPCYSTYLQAGTQYGIWKNSDSAYDAWVGQCVTQFDQCKEFVDPQDTSPVHPNGQPYYAIKNDRLDSTTCQNRASLTQSPTGAGSASACVLFWQTDDLHKTFDASATYEASDAQHGALVNAVTDAGNDSNIVIRVARDRQCGQWLECRTSETVFNQSSGQYQNVCTSFGLCAEYERIGNTTQCVRYVDSDYSGKTLTPSIYQARDTGWKGEEYTSYAIPNQYPVNELVTADVGPGSGTSTPDLRLVRVIGDCSGAYGSECGPAGDKGSCLGPPSARKCVYPIDDGFKVSGAGADVQLKQSRADAGYPGTSCRAYAAESAPFPSTVADPSGWNLNASTLNQGNPVLIGPSPAYARANVCQRRLVNGVETSSCECNYMVGKYGATTKYFPADSADLPLGYCSGGTYDNYECDPLASGMRSKTNLSCCTTNPSGDSFTGLLSGGASNSCDDGSQCVRLSKLDREVGYEGQCLERDFTTPINGRNDEYACLTWRPVGLVGGSRDIYNQNQTAGYFAAPDRRFYCVGAQDPWAVMFEIKPQNSNGDGHPDTSQPNGGPASQDTNNYFGHGVVENGNPSHAQSEHVTCEDDPGVPAGDWCVWPTNINASYAVQSDGGHPSHAKTCPTSDNGTKGPCDDGFVCHVVPGDSVGQCVADSNHPTYTIGNDAIGILGCYEVADAGSYKTTYIDYPYIGPPLYRQQLQSIYFQMTNDIYYDDDNESNLPTNPQNEVRQDCNDDGDDSNIDAGDHSHDKVTIADVALTETITTNGQTKVVSANSGPNAKSLYYLEESDNWSVDVSNGGGVVILSATFDKNGLLQKLRVAADDHDDSGTFGINRMGFVFKPGCQQIAQVDQPGEFGATKAFTNTLNPYRDFGTRAVEDVYNNIWKLTDACIPFGAIGSVASTPTDPGGATHIPWTYVASRDGDPDGSGPLTGDTAQCTQTDYVKGATYLIDKPESLGLTFNTINAEMSIRQLFRNLYGLWQYVPLQVDGTGGGYTSADLPTDIDETGLTDISSMIYRFANWEPPRIASVDTNACDSQGHCKAGLIDSLTVNGKQKGLVFGADGAMNVTAKFYAWASDNAMPILNRTVIWGDLAPTEPPAKGWYKNQKPICSPDTSDENAIGRCDNFPGLTCSDKTDCPGQGTCTVDKTNHFGDTPGACNSAPFQSDHVYTCSLKDLEAMPLCTGPDEAADNAPCYRLLNNAPICVYRPKVQITDNWNWCNCTGSACQVTGGAYKTGCATDHPPSNARPWTEYSGEVRLTPTIKDAQAFVPGSGGSGGSGGLGGPSGGTAVDDSYTSVSGTTYGQHSLLDNDTLVGQTATRQVVMVDPPQHGTMPGICDPNGCFTITPGGYINYVVTSGYHGLDTFTYKIVQDGNDSNVATVTITNP